MRRWAVLGCGLLLLLLVGTLFVEELPEEASASEIALGDEHRTKELATPRPSAPDQLRLRAKPAKQKRAEQKRAPAPPFVPQKAQAVPYPMKVFIYDDVAPHLNHHLQGKEACLSPYTAAETVIPDLVAKSSLYTPHGELADYYIVPLLCECFMVTKLHKGYDFNRAANALNAAFQKTLDHIQSKYPFWSRTEGRDHIFIFPTERGPSILSDANMHRIRKALFVMGTVGRSLSRFNSWKDIVVPPARGPWTPPADTLPPAPKGYDPGEPGRTTLLHFRGALPGKLDLNPWGVRNVLSKNLRREENIIFEEATAACGRQCTRQEMLRSQFCLVPAGGVEGWSLRLYDAIQLGCVPVIMADDAEMAFEGQIDYSKFSIKLLESTAEDVADMIRTVGLRVHRAKQQALTQAADSFRWHDTWVEGDAFDALLKELHYKLRFMRNSPYRFWSSPVPTG